MTTQSRTKVELIHCRKAHDWLIIVFLILLVGVLPRKFTGMGSRLSFTDANITTNQSVSAVQGDPEILIVGSGPSGLVLALSLLKNAVPVRIIEKSTSWRVGQRGAGISPRSLELMESLGILDQVLQRAVGVPMIRFYKMPGGTKTLKEMSPTPTLEPTPSFPYRNFCTLGQDNLEAILRIEIAKFGCQVELGAELETLQPFENRVEAIILHHQRDSEARVGVDVATHKEMASYKWVVGADGARGTVRKELDLPFVGETTGENFIIGDMLLDEESGLDPDRWHMWGGISDVSAAIRPTETPGLFAFILGGANLPPQDAICASVDSVKEHIKCFAGGREDIKIKEIVWMSPFKINIRMVEKFREGRVFIVGDAGHVHSMTGGQGMNSGIQDSFNLGWKLALVVKGLAVTSLLDSYTSERLPIIAEMLQITTTILKRTVGDTQGRGWDRSGSIHQLGVNYRGSSIVLDEIGGEDGSKGHAIPSYAVEEGSSVQPGDRAPDASGLVRSLPSEASDDSELVPTARKSMATTRLFDLFSPSRHTVIIFSFSNPPEGDGIFDYHPLLEFLRSHPVLRNLVTPIIIQRQGENIQSLEAFEDRDGHATEAYRDKNGALGVFIVRPDGVVGARIASVEGLERYFKGVFTRI